MSYRLDRLLIKFVRFILLIAWARPGGQISKGGNGHDYKYYIGALALCARTNGMGRAELRAMPDSLAARYAATPYRHGAIQHAGPAGLGAIGRLHRLNCAPPDRCRV